MTTDSLQRSVPKLRFPEFEGKSCWIGLPLAELEAKGKIELGRGKVISRANMRTTPGPYPVYSSSIVDEGLMGTYGNYLFDEELISWSIDGGGHFFYRPKHKFSVTNVSGFIRLLCCNIVCRFLAYQLQQLHGAQFFNYQQKAHPSVIRTLYKIALPEPDEQQKIAECLASLDALIAAESQKLESLRQHKKGLMQQLFPQPGETIPKLRFPGFEDTSDWNGFPLAELEAKGKIELGRGKVISHADMRTTPGPYPVYSSSVIDKGLMGTYGKYFFDEELISWSVDGGGHFFYRPKHKFSVTNVSGFMRLLCSSIDCRFLAYQLQQLHGSQFFNYQQKAHPSVIRTLYQVSLPEPDEQQIIADCLGSMDDLITVAGRKIETLRQHKQGLVQQLFPRPETE